MKTKFKRGLFKAQTNQPQGARDCRPQLLTLVLPREQAPDESLLLPVWQGQPPPQLQGIKRTEGQTPIHPEGHEWLLGELLKTLATNCIRLSPATQCLTIEREVDWFLNKPKPPYKITF